MPILARHNGVPWDEQLETKKAEPRHRRFLLKLMKPFPGDIYAKLPYHFRGRRKASPSEESPDRSHSRARPDVCSFHIMILDSFGSQLCGPVS